MKSTLYSINAKDFLKGLIVAVGTAVIPILMASLNVGELVFNWKAIIATAASALLTYLAKNFFTDDTKEAVKTLEKQNVQVTELRKPTVNTKK